MKSNTLPIYKEWLSQASPEQIDFVDSVFAECEKHYNAGGDNVVETFEPDEIVQQFKSLDDVREYCGLKVEQESNARWGEDSDPELKRLKDFDQWNNPDREIGERDDYFDENAARDQAGSSGGSLIQDEIERRALERDEYENEKYEKDQDGRPIDPPLPFTRNDGGNASFSSSKNKTKQAGRPLKDLHPFADDTPDTNEDWIAVYVDNLKNNLPQIQHYLDEVGRQTPISTVDGKMFDFNTIDLLEDQLHNMVKAVGGLKQEIQRRNEALPAESARLGTVKIQIKKYASGWLNTPSLPGQMFKTQKELVKAVTAGYK
jgi:hypothetical protein